MSSGKKSVEELSFLDVLNLFDRFANQEKSCREILNMIDRFEKEINRIVFMPYNEDQREAIDDFLGLLAERVKEVIDRAY